MTNERTETSMEPTKLLTPQDLDVGTWAPILAKAIPKASLSDPVSEDMFVCADIAEVVAESSGKGEGVGLFILRDGRAALVRGECQRREIYAWAGVGSSVYKLFLGRPLGNVRHALFRRFTQWHHARCARKLLALLERGDRGGWTYRRVLGDKGSSCSAAWVLDDELVAAQDYAPNRSPVRVVFVGGMCSFAMANQIVPTDYRGFDRVLCAAGHLTPLDVPPPMETLAAWRCHCAARAAWYSVLNMVESPTGVFGRYATGACGLAKKGTAKPAPVASKSADATTVAKKQCDTCRKSFDADALTSADRTNDFWRCRGCAARLFTMLASMEDQPSTTTIYEVVDAQGWGWISVEGGTAEALQ